jgi:hypothetical protein
MAHPGHQERSNGALFQRRHPPGLDGTWDFVRTDSVGGAGFSAISLLGFAECFRDAVRADGDDDGDPV